MAVVEPEPLTPGNVRAVRSGGDLVGFVVLWDSAGPPGHVLWRLR
ncbi:hypothetical protein SAMN05660464_3979 [Geodermatophilus dictyosporus]|uniref:Uncharacterized protein n=1 Tax=Geodermatophilus dictyosporus TaxID=1523247 RepID=A0A1I5SH08_9ACTN|nr:hypothetical protein [Geodermatophilus dictyosporus]SFP69998.1 hypothetical protein SAMN05660464_3979 [Geodermatophilus dictyosporus]